MRRDFKPTLPNNLPPSVPLRFPIHNRTELDGAILRAGVDETRPRLRIIVFRKAVMALNIVRHHTPASFKNRSASFTRNLPEIRLGSSVSRSLDRVNNSC